MKKAVAFSMGLGLSLMAGIMVGDVELKRIVVAEDAAPTAKLAAAHLQEYVGKVSGSRLEMVGKAPEANGNIFVGERAAMVKDLKPEGYRIVAKDGNVYITGRDAKSVVFGIRNPWNKHEVYNDALQLGAFGEAGTLYGVNNFLEKYAGVRFYWPGELGTVVPKKEIRIPAVLDEGNYPKFMYRHIWLCNFNNAPEDAVWYRRIGLGGKAPVQIIDYNAPLTKAFKETHPEYLALVDGERDTDKKCASRGGGSLCYTAPGCKEAVAAYIINFFKEHPEHNCFPLVPGDGYWRSCECENCKKRYDINAPRRTPDKFSFHQWDFVNEVAKIVGKEFPDKFVGCLAYEGYLVPPKEIDKLSPNVAVMFCKNRSTMASPAYAKAMHERVESWKEKVSTGLFAWDYYLHCWKPWRELPVFFMHTIQNDIQYEMENGFKGEFIEAESWRGGGKTCVNYPATQHLNLYVTGKLYWNPDLDMDALLDEYYTMFYGPAAEPMKKFISTAEGYWNETNRKNTKTTGIFEAVHVADVFYGDRIKVLKGHLTEALEKAPEGSQYRARIDQMAKEFKTCERLERSLAPLDLKNDPIATKLPEQFRKGKVFCFLPNDYTLFGSSVNLVDDSESVVGKAARVTGKGVELYKLPFGMGCYNVEAAKTIKYESFNTVKGKGYEWYKMGRVTLSDRSDLFFNRAWTIQLPVSYPRTLTAGKTFDIWASLKFTGPMYQPDEKDGDSFMYLNFVVLKEVEDNKQGE
ncbi:MAG: DUF4838 domain-containing protein [Victivallales bacterium]|nr:DUF4838 domain-containing protein [Victivallales bacterium]